MPRRVRRLGVRISTVRSERLLVERLDFDLSFRRFVGLGIDDRAWDASTFSKNRDRLLDGDVAMCFLTAILDRLQVKRLVSTEPFSVDGTLIKARASMKSFRRRDDGRSGEPPADGGSSGKLAEGRNGEVDFHGENSMANGCPLRDVAASRAVSPRATPLQPFALASVLEGYSVDMVLRFIVLGPPSWPKWPSKRTV